MMTDEEALHYMRLVITDRITYVGFSTPDFPSEDRTSLEKEKAEIQRSIAEYRKKYSEVEEHPSFRLFLLELDEAFEAAACGSDDALPKFLSARDRFEESFVSPRGPGFIAGPSGLTKT